MDPYQNSRVYGSPVPERVQTPEGAGSNASPPPPSVPYVARQTSSARSPTVDHRGRDRDIHRSHVAPRRNEYFLPKEGIDKEVIQADIGRYLGNDASVRIGNYQDPTTRIVRQGYLINAYRNLTTAMIEDLKSDTERWRTEMSSPTSRGRTPTIEYGSSTTHQSRQYYGPTEAPINPTSGNPSSEPSYSTYSNPSSNYPNTASYDPSSSGYPSASTDSTYGSNSNTGGYTYTRSSQDYITPQNPSGAPNYPNPTSPGEYGGRSDYPYGSSTAANTSAYYPSQSNPISLSQYQPSPNVGDPYYHNRGPTSSGYENNRGEGYENTYQGPSQGPTQDYSQIPRTAPVTGSTHQSSRRSDRDSGHRDSDRRDRHSHQSRR
ncbi:hypothetical protein HYALB_00009398 [Hymenoscyphus albidus]|uniref:Transcription factor RfeG n=1 Tax=Hymenoscyphus albidus TaxID=595503 RepID=A0A9N9LKK4_9HELO|nr:hypothetical protein HYALB_00009398 [Hymenoscyphus albidus]